MNGLHRINLPDSGYGPLTIWRAIPKGENPWGVLDPIRGTEWERWVPVIDGESFSHAMHGHHQPMMDQLGPDPRHLGKRIRPDLKPCKQIRSCVMAEPSCIPENPKLPECYEAPLEDLEAARIASYITLLWRDGQYVVVVTGDEFSI